MNRRLRLCWPPGIRAQVMCWFCAIFILLTFLFGMVFYARLSHSLESSFDQTLRERTSQIALGIVRDDGVVKIRDVTGQLPDIDQDDPTGNGGHQAPGGSAGAASDRLGTLVRVLDAQGHVLYVTPAFRSLRLPPESSSLALAGHDWLVTVSAGDGRSVRVYSKVLADANGIYAVLQVGSELEPLETMLNSVVIELLIIAPFVILLGACGSYWLVTRALTPIVRLTETAHTIGAGDLHQRVPLPAADDEVRHLAVTFNEMIERLEQAFARQRRFVADASHELRTPVAAIRSMAEVTLVQGATPEEYTAILRAVAAGAERLGRLINDLLMLARADEGHLRLEREPVHLDLLVAEVAATLEPLANEAGVLLQVRPAAGPVIVEGDEARLMQVVMNLLDNALAYTEAGGRVTLTVEICEREQGHCACLSVADSGVGIPPEHLPHIFERFYRVDPARSHTTGGNGLGLAIVDWIVRSHGGAISVSSEPGCGTTFQVRLPLLRSAEPRPAGRKPAALSSVLAAQRNLD